MIIPLRSDFLKVAGKPARKAGNAKAAARARRYRRRKRDARGKQRDAATVTVDTIAICQLAARVGAGNVTADDLQMAERLLLALAAMLPPDGAIGLPRYQD